MNITKPPVSYRMANDHGIIWWETDSTETYGHGVELELSGSDPVVVSAHTTNLSTFGRKAAIHAVFLPDLHVDSLFSIRVIGPGFRSSVVNSFRTHGPESSIRIGIINSVEGYFGTSSPGLQYALDKIGGVDRYLSCGGLLAPYDDITYEDWDSWYKAAFNFLVDAPMLMAKSSNDAGLISEVMAPTHFPGKPFYAASVGPARLVALDTSTGGRTGLYDGAQRSWALNEFNSAEWKAAKYRIILASDPPRVTLWDQSKSYGQRTGTDRFLFKNLLPLVAQSGADLVIYGRCHSYQRGSMQSAYPNHESSVIHHVACGGIAPAHTVTAWQWGPNDPPGIFLSSSAYHYVTMDISPSGLSLSCRNMNTDELIDELQVEPHTLY
jgi:hypothetical protein